jgi:hypothetical protein
VETTPAEKRTAAYMPWPTLQQLFETLTAGMPHRVDRSIFPTYSGGVIAQTLVSLRFLGLIEKDGAPTALLGAIVAATDDAQRRKLLRGMVDNAYADLLAIDLSKATVAMFMQKLTSEYGLTGSTRDKAARFFLTAAEHVGIPLSPYLINAKGKRATANGSASSRVGRIPRRKRGAAATKISLPGPESAGAIGAMSLAIDLRSGARVTVTMDGNYMVLSSADRRFLDGLITKLQSYAEAGGDGDAT